VTPVSIYSGLQPNFLRIAFTGISEKASAPISTKQETLGSGVETKAVCNRYVKK
jgi:hypothetical protein